MIKCKPSELTDTKVKDCIFLFNNSLTGYKLGPLIWRLWKLSVKQVKSVFMCVVWTAEVSWSSFIARTCLTNWKDIYREDRITQRLRVSFHNETFMCDDNWPAGNKERVRAGDVTTIFGLSNNDWWYFLMLNVEIRAESNKPSQHFGIESQTYW